MIKISIHSYSDQETTLLFDRDHCIPSEDGFVEGSEKHPKISVHDNEEAEEAEESEEKEDVLFRFFRFFRSDEGSFLITVLRGPKKKTKKP